MKIDIKFTTQERKIMPPYNRKEIKDRITESYNTQNDQSQRESRTYTKDDQIRHLFSNTMYPELNYFEWKHEVDRLEYALGIFNDLSGHNATLNKRPDGSTYIQLGEIIIEVAQENKD